MRKTLLPVIITLMAMPAWAAPVTQRQAIATAQAFFASKGITMTTEGDGDIRLQATGGGKVKLGDTALQPAVLGNTLYDWMQTVENRFTTLGAQASTLLAAYNAHTHAVSTAPGTTATAVPPASPSPPTPPVPPDPRATDTEVK